jgi:hypothetical protein
MNVELGGNRLASDGLGERLRDGKVDRRYDTGDSAPPSRSRRLAVGRTWVLGLRSAVQGNRDAVGGLREG